MHLEINGEVLAFDYVIANIDKYTEQIIAGNYKIIDPIPDFEDKIRQLFDFQKSKN
jgi:hypothetical protein